MFFFPLLLLVVSFCQDPSLLPTAKEEKCLINQPVLPMYEECLQTSSYVSQGIYGHSAYIVEKLDEGWAKIRTEDGYEGYALLEGLVQDDPRWKTSLRSVRISSIAGMVYPIPDTEKPALLRLPFGARVVLLEKLDASNKRWLEVELLDGRRGWIQRGDVEKPTIRGKEEVLLLTKKFLELPYIWGGTSSEGYTRSVSII